MPAWLQPVANANPVTAMVDAVRALFIGTPAGNSIWGAVIWCAVIVGVFAPLSGLALPASRHALTGWPSGANVSGQ